MALRLPEDFREFLRLLDSNGVEYLLVGGYAVGYYGYSRPTADMDIWVRISEGNAALMVKVLRDFGFRVKALRKALFLKEDQVVRLGVPPMRLEILTSISGVEFDPCYKARKVAPIDGVDVSIISLRHLKRNKKAAGRLKDLDDLQNL
jgi:hypothetical protein